MLESLTHMAALVQIFAGLGVVTVFLAVLKRYIERRCWRQFKILVDDWIQRLRESEEVHPHDLSADDWKVRCERFLMNAKFSPLEIQQLLDTAVIVARGIASEKYFL